MISCVVCKKQMAVVNSYIRKENEMAPNGRPIDSARLYESALCGKCAAMVTQLMKDEQGLTVEEANATVEPLPNAIQRRRDEEAEADRKAKVEREARAEADRKAREAKRLEGIRKLINRPHLEMVNGGKKAAS